jgi:hypothetical protein
MMQARRLRPPGAGLREASRSRRACCASGSSRPRPGGCRPTSSTPACSTTAPSWAALAEFYARRLLASAWPFDMLFGPAYKGITLAAAVAIELARLGRNVPYAYNRKEAKDHGEGGTLVGAPVRGPRADHRRRHLGRHLGARVDRDDHRRRRHALRRGHRAGPPGKATEDGADAPWSAVQYVTRQLACRWCGDRDAGRPAAVSATRPGSCTARPRGRRAGLPRALRGLNVCPPSPCEPPFRRRSAALLAMAIALVTAWRAGPAGGHQAGVGRRHLHLHRRQGPPPDVRPADRRLHRPRSSRCSTATARCAPWPPTLTAEERAEKEARERAGRRGPLGPGRCRAPRPQPAAPLPDEAAHQQGARGRARHRALAIKATELRLRDLAAERKPLVDEAEFYKGKPCRPS